MIGDVYFLSYPERIVGIAKEITDNVNFPDKFYIKDSETLHGLKKMALNYIKAYKKFISYERMVYEVFGQRNRIFLGNASKPVLTRGRAIEEFRAGTTLDEIKEKYRGWDNKPLAQWKAHFTMGTYGTKKPDYVATENGDIKKLTKPEALDLLSSGIPINEIVDSFPTSFSAAQLRALKAHITMGTYSSKIGKE